MIPTVLAQQDAGGQAPALVGFLPIVLIILIFYFLLYRPMRKRQRNLEAMVASLKNGDKVITSGGIYGTISGIKDHTVMLKVADQSRIEVAKSAIAALQSPPDGGAKS